MVKSADRTIDLLEYLANTAEAPSFTRIATDLAIPKSSLSQLLATLVARDYVETSATSGTYRLGPRVQLLARRAVSEIPLEQIVDRTLERLRATLRETVAFHVRNGDEVEVIAAVTSPQALALTMTPGDRAPLYAMSAGKVILSALSAKELLEYLQRTTLSSHTRRTIRTKSALRRELREIQRTGVAFGREEFLVGIEGASVAVAMGQHLIGALNVAVPVSRYTEALDLSLRTMLPAAADEIATALGHFNPVGIAAAVSDLLNRATTGLAASRARAPRTSPDHPASA